jgi:hypothetical protein
MGRSFSRPVAMTTKSVAAAAAAANLIDLTQMDDDSVTTDPLTQNPPDNDDEEEQTLFGRYIENQLLVGIQFYRGTAHPGEYVTLVREPHNPYDSNAIRCDNSKYMSKIVCSPETKLRFKYYPFC